MLDSHIIAKAEISWYQGRVGNSNTLFTFFIIRLYPISGSLYITQEIFCEWLSFLLKAIVLVVSHPAYGVGYDYPSPHKNDLCFCICSLWKKHPDSCDVFIMSWGWFSSHFVTSILIFLPKLKNSSHFELQGKAPPENVYFGVFRGGTE